MKIVARFVRRDSDDNTPDGLMIGTMMKSASDLIKSGVIYEIREICGVLTVAEVGPCAVKVAMTSCSDLKYQLPVCWSHTIDYVLEVGGKYNFLTEKEIVNEMEKEND